MPKVVIRVDEAGEWPVLRDDGDELPAGWRFVCDVGSVAEGNAVRSVWLRRRLSPEVRHELEEEAAGASLEMRHSTSSPRRAS